MDDPLRTMNPVGDGAASDGRAEPSDAPGSGPPSGVAQPDSILTASALVKRYPTADGGLEVLSGATMSVAAGELVAIVGESGTGKSTLLHLLGALDRPTSGRVAYHPPDGGPTEDVFALGDDALAAFRNRAIGFVFQFHHLLPEFTAAENVEMPALIAGRAGRASRERAHALLTQLGLSARVEHRPSQLSGGEQQRVAVARALMNRPGLVLMDEPTGNLDTRTAGALHDEIRRLADDERQAFVVVTHNPTLAALADRVLRLEGGVLIDERSAQPEAAPEPVDTARS